jgi:hypothetical protein
MLSAKQEVSMAGIPLSDADQLADPMSEEYQVRANLNALRESIRLDWVDIAERTMTPEERREVREHIKICVSELSSIIARLEELDAHRT